MPISYDNKTFRAVSNTQNGETSLDTVFHYRQTGTILTANYSGGRIVTGHLLGLVDENGHLDFRYHQLNTEGKLMTGWCRSVPEILPTGKIRLHETWQWTSGDESAGTSIVDED
ncbi:n-acetylglutamate synthase [Fibrella aquatica]|uniref:n-acetylglutamate synthase n=1 Tax=Fibrella aquatica TaxID=3242487 RepID=UPI00351F8E0C